MTDERKYRTYYLPYDKSEKVIQEWGTEALKDIFKRGIRFQTNFAPNRKDDSDFEKNTYFDYINLMYSLIEGTWDGKESEYMSKDAEDDLYLPARLVNYPLIKNKFDHLCGRFVTEQAECIVNTVNEDGITKKMNERGKLMFKAINKDFVGSLQNVISTQLEPSLDVPENINKLLRVPPKTANESAMQKIITYLHTKYGWTEVFKQGFMDNALLGFFFYRGKEVNKDFTWVRCNPKQVLTDWSGESPYFDDAMYFAYETYMSRPEIIDEFGEYYTEEIQKQVDDIYENRDKYGDTTIRYIDGELKVHIVIGNWKAIWNSNHIIRKNPKNPDVPIIKMLNNGDKVKEDENTKVKKLPLYQAWSGVLIANSVAIAVKPIANQIRDYENPRRVYFDFFGGKYNVLDKKPIGIGESVFNLQIFWNEIFFKLNHMISTSGGKAIEYDVTMKPKNVPLTNVFYYMKSKNIIQVNRSGTNANKPSLREYNLGAPADTGQFLINMLMMIESVVDKITGVPQMAAGEKTADQYVGTLTKTINQSNITTKPLFTFHREALRRMMRHTLSKMKILWKDGKKASYVLGDGTIDFLNIEPGMFVDDYDIYFNDGTQDAMTKELLIMLGQQAMASRSATFEHMVTVVKQKNLPDTYAELERMFDEMHKQEKESSEMMQQVEQMKLQLPQVLQQMKDAIKKFETESKNMKDLTVADIYAKMGIKQELLKHELSKQEKQ